MMKVEFGSFSVEQNSTSAVYIVHLGLFHCGDLCEK